MTVFRRYTFFVALVLLLSACNSFDALPTLVPTIDWPTAPVATHTVAPTAGPTAVPATATFAATATRPLSPTATQPPPPTPSLVVPPTAQLPSLAPRCTQRRAGGRALPGTATASPTVKSESFVFAVCGDSRGGDEVYRQILSMAVQDGSAFLVNLGDIVNEGQIEQLEHVHALMAEYPLEIFIAPGNHDRLNGSLENYLSVFAPPAPDFSFDRGQLHFVFLDASAGVLFASQLEWLDAELAATTQPVTLIFLHPPPFDPAGTDHIMGAAGRDAFMELVKKHSVDYVFAAHIHSFDYELRDGTHYYITGGAGASLYPHYQRDAFYHYLQVQASGTDVQVELVRLD